MIVPHRRTHMPSRRWTAQGNILGAIKSNLKAYFPLGETSGNRIDLVGGYIAAPVSTPGNTTGIYGNGLNRSASNGLLVDADSYDVAALLATNVWTLNFWLKHGTSSGNYVMGVGKTGTGGVSLVLNRNGTTGFYRVYLGPNVQALDYTNSALADGTFHMITIRDNVDTVDLFTDATKRATYYPADSIGDATYDFGIGCTNDDNTPTWANALAAVVDEFSIWDKNLSTDVQIPALYNTGVGAFYKG